MINVREPHTTTRSHRGALATVGLGLLLALAFALATYTIARALGEDLIVSGPAGEVPVPVGAVVGATTLGAVAAWALARWAAGRARPQTAFVTAVAIGLGVSSVPPLTAASGATTAWLLLLHAVVAVPLLTAAWWYLRLVRPS